MFNKKTHHLQLADHSMIYYETYGQGMPLFLLHGNSGSTLYFKNQIHVLKKYFKIYAVDLRGRGQSIDYASKINYQLMVNDLLTILKHEHLTKINLLGFSDGANLALLFSEHYPQYINKLILNAANNSFTDLTPTAKLRFKLTNDILKLGEKYFPKLNKFQHYFQLAFANLHINFQKLAHFKFPVLILVGQFDIVKKEFSQKLAHTFPNAQLIIEPHVGHSFALERPNTYNKYVLNFLNNK